MIRYRNVPMAAFIAAIGMTLLMSGGCGPKGDDDSRAANAPPVNVNAPPPANAPAGAAGSIQASQAQGAAMASKAAADGEAYKRAMQKAGR